jgi:hypothetical protein
MRLLFILAHLLSAALSLAQDAYLNTSFVPRYWKANEPWPIAARVRNASSTVPLITFRVDWRFNNGPIQVGNTQSTTGILPGQYWPYTHPTSFTAPASGGTLKVWVVGIGDTNHSNDTLYFTVDVLSAWATKSVLIEQYTGTWCQFCPLPNEATNTLNDDPLIVVAKHHNGDEYSSASSTAYWQQFSANYSPAGVMEQEEFGTLGDDAAYDQWGARADRISGERERLVRLQCMDPEPDRRCGHDLRSCANGDIRNQRVHPRGQHQRCAGRRRQPIRASASGARGARGRRGHGRGDPGHHIRGQHL